MNKNKPYISKYFCNPTIFKDFEAKKEKAEVVLHQCRETCNYLFILHKMNIVIDQDFIGKSK